MNLELCLTIFVAVVAADLVKGLARSFFDVGVASELRQFQMRLGHSFDQHAYANALEKISCNIERIRVRLDDIDSAPNG